MLQPNRQYSAGDYRYGFNGKELDNEVKGEGAQYDYGFRIYDPRMVKFLSIDPLTKSYPWYTPYQYAGNTPIQAVDIDGKEELIVVRWFEGKTYIGETVFRVDNVDHRDLGKKEGNDMQLIELPASQKDQFNNRVNSKDIQDVMDYLLVPNKGVFKGRYLQRIPEKYQGKLAVLRQKDAADNQNALILPQPLRKEAVFFKYDKDEVKFELSAQTLEKIKKELTDDPEAKLSIVGYASNENDTGDPKHNEVLSTKRANAVQAYLIKNGIKADRILSVEGAGGTDKFGDSKTDEGKIQNRRAEITFTYGKMQ